MYIREIGDGRETGLTTEAAYPRGQVHKKGVKQTLQEKWTNS